MSYDKCNGGSELDGEINAVAIHQTLKQAREQAGLTLEKAADCIGISGASFSRMENGLSKVTMDRLEVLSALYEVSASALVEGSIVTKPSTIDIDRLKLVVEAVQQVVNERKVHPSPEKMAMAVAELYRLEITHIVNDVTAVFNPSRHMEIVRTMFSI
ncbi:helix-turn-helix transcriptional regulator [Ascidiaceihabitans sp.]|uniref:helix-turn-helix domain-containing protein n=1 Tax=Ascidiaceihabitans sp. TaxID=1872644 RepID=UPI003296C3CA